MIIKEMFEKDIERDIRGVIKVAQTSEEDIKQELEEYVVTKELNRHIATFYDNYLKGIDGHTDKMGVWISGFFGSGKSHFLKILAYLLDDKEVKDKKPVEYFESKIKDPILFGNMQRASKIDSEVILFNIDSKSALDNKSKEDAILKVFMKVFNEHRGYYGDEPGIAKMEEYLDDNHQYETFKNRFKELSGESWEERRSAFYFDRDYIIESLIHATSMSKETAENWFDNGVENFEISIEKFAKDVKTYIDSKGPNFHLIFLVDEIGQYIGDNRNLMLNLQTLTEDLGVHAEGKVWIMVTSQESIDSIVKVKGDDFSRIQGRFDTRLSLSSISVGEVIKKRILEKDKYGNNLLRSLYPEKSAILKNLISFKDSTADFKGYSDDIDFAEVYPFVPYQFTLLQKVFEQVRRHGSSGIHLSEGERSMLSAFKESAYQIKDKSVGALVPFYAFYDTIQEFLNPSVTRVIENAKINTELADDEFNINLLKVLFLIKHVREIPENIENIATLMITGIDDDKLALKEKIKESLKKLESQTLIQKNGDIYSFLTDDEQDINKEIKQLIIDEELVKRELADYVFEDLYPVKKYRYNKDYDFAFNQKMDEKNRGKQLAPIGMHILSPIPDFYHKSAQELMMFSQGTGEMIVRLNGNDDYIDEMTEVLKIEEYRKKKNTMQQSEIVNSILSNKQLEVNERRRRVTALLEEAIKQAELYINGQKVTVKGSTVKEKLDNGLKELIENVFTKLNYIKEPINTEVELKNLIVGDSNQSIDFNIAGDENQSALDEVIRYIDNAERSRMQLRPKGIYDHFSSIPYGWEQLDIAALIIKLLVNQKIRISHNSKDLNPANDVRTIIDVLTKNSEIDRAIIKKRVMVDDNLIRIAKKIAKEVFNKTNVGSEEDTLHQDIKQLIEEKISEIKRYEAEYNLYPYPGKGLIEKGLELLTPLIREVDNINFFTSLKDNQEELIQWQEEFENVISFFESNQREIFDNGRRLLKRYEQNKGAFDSEEIHQQVNSLNEIINNPIPYSRIRVIPEIEKYFDNELEMILKNKKIAALDIINQNFKEAKLLIRQYHVTDQTKNIVEERFQSDKTSIENSDVVTMIDGITFQNQDYINTVKRLVNADIDAAEKRQTELLKDRTTVIEKGEPLTSPKIMRVKRNEILPVQSLSNEQDIDSYIETLSNKLKNMIKDNDRIEFVD